MNLEPNSTPTYSSIPEPFEIASIKLRSARRQKSNVLEFRICPADDSSLPVPPGARLGGRPASQVEVAKKAYQLERARQADGLVDVNSDIYCVACRQLVSDCACEKTAAANGNDNAAPAEAELPFDRARRRRRERLAARRRLRRSMEGKVP